MLQPSEIAAIRFGIGLSPMLSGPSDAAGILAQLAQFDQDAVDLPIPPFDMAHPSIAEQRAIGRDRNRANQSGDAAAIEAARVATDVLNDAMRDQLRMNLRMTLARGVAARDGFRERLTRFWADHFTVKSRNAGGHHLVTPYVEEAIRPHVAGRFVDLLWSATTHPMMLIYLNQVESFGPNSPLGQSKGRGLNENLARELLELHTLGVGAPYTGDDVLQLAKLLTGLTYTWRDGFAYDARMAEPGAESVLGVTYPADSDLSVVRTLIEDLAVHPATAQHISRKIARYFVADHPDDGLVAVMTDAFVASAGDLMAVYEAMLDHPAAWDPVLQKVKLPLDFVTSGLRALGLTAEQVMSLPDNRIHRSFLLPMRVMGQDWERPIGPDGWADEAEAWINPPGMAGRITWALRDPKLILSDLPDPREFVHWALGAEPPEQVLFAARAAETREEGVGIILASAAFQRR